MAGIYIHIPFCRQACYYCDFHFSTSIETIDAMVSSIGNELSLRRGYLEDEIIDTIYFGGGTPSLVGAERISSFLKKIHEHFKVKAGAEVTLEANPDDITKENARQLRNAGINRLSIGIQSFSDDDLKFMNRAHDSKQALSAIEIARSEGFDNISIDLIYGIPTSPPRQWEKNVEMALALGIDHLSCYALTIEPRTALADMIRKKKVPAPDDEKTVSEFETLIAMTTSAGFEHYEISNFARNKKYSVHNTSYWQGKKYLGAGPSAHSFDRVSRQWNISNNREYIRSINESVIPFEKEILTETNRFNEYILISLRTMWGVDISYLEKEFGPTLKKEFIDKAILYEKDEMLVISETKVTLTDKGKFFADRIASELFI